VRHYRIELIALSLRLAFSTPALMKNIADTGRAKKNFSEVTAFSRKSHMDD
jgi:hypothetical protein